MMRWRSWMPCGDRCLVRSMRPRWLCAWADCLVVLPLLVCAPAWAQGDYLDALQARATELRLADTRAWHALLHYERDWRQPGVTSTVTTDWFFRAPNGRTRPAAELLATLADFFDPRNIEPRKAPARCVFPARYRYLDRHLQIDAARLPDTDCRAYRQWRQQLDPAAVSLVFPAAYMNNPASMFGHTLLRIDSKLQGRGNELLARAVNFAAETDDEIGLVFAFKGLTGGYPGSYGVFPFYRKVKEYAWIENRDIWSYPLALSQAELERLVAHLWALRGVHFDYYFFTKNCSYQLLALLQAVRPELRLTESFDWYAIPADTIRRLGRVPGLLGQAHYRPALATRLRWHADLLTRPRRALALAVAAGRVAPDARRLHTLEPRARARVLEVAHDYLYYRQQAAAVPAQAVAQRIQRILLARSHITVDSGFPPVPEPSLSPAQGHGTLRLAAGGVWEDGQFSLGLRLRPAYHDLLDPPGGYIAGAQISFLDLRLRIDVEDEDIAVDRLALVDITSISTRGALFKPVSWRISTGLRQRPVSAPFAPDSRLGYYLQGGPGLAWGEADRLAGYVFGLASADVNGGFEQGYALGAGGSAGLVAYPVPGWQLRVEAGVIQYLAGDDGRRSWIALIQQWPLGGNLALRVGIGYHHAAGYDFARAAVMLQGYFDGG